MRLAYLLLEIILSLNQANSKWSVHLRYVLKQNKKKARNLMIKSSIMTKTLDPWDQQISNEILEVL